MSTSARFFEKGEKVASVSHTDVMTKHGNVGVGNVWVVRKQDGTRATLYMGNRRGDFFEVTQLLPSLDIWYVFSRHNFESCSSAKFVVTLPHCHFVGLVDKLRTDKIADMLKREHNSF